MKVQTTGLSDVGCVRQMNEDAFRIDKALGIYVVADVDGGTAAGIASQQAMRVFFDTLEQEGLARRRSNVSHIALVDALKRAIRAAEKHTRDHAHGQLAMTALWLLRGKALVAHTGRCRLYLQREDGLRRISRDALPTNTIEIYAPKNFATAETMAIDAVPSTQPVEMDIPQHIDTRVFSVRRGDAFMLCTDGLTQHVGDDEIDAALGACDPPIAARHMLHLARARGGMDNITLITVLVQDPFDLPKRPSTRKSVPERNPRHAPSRTVVTINLQDLTLMQQAL